MPPLKKSAFTSTKKNSVPTFSRRLNPFAERFQDPSAEIQYDLSSAEIQYYLSSCTLGDLQDILYDVIADHLLHGKSEETLIRHFAKRFGDHSAKIQGTPRACMLLAKYLPMRDLSSLMLTCKSWRQAFLAPSNNKAWMIIHQTKYLDIVPTSFPTDQVSWFRLIQYAHHKRIRRNQKRDAKSFKEFLQDAKEPLVEYPKNLVFNWIEEGGTLLRKQPSRKRIPSRIPV